MPSGPRFPLPGVCSRVLEAVAVLGALAAARVMAAQGFGKLGPPPPAGLFAPTPAPHPRPPPQLTFTSEAASLAFRALMLWALDRSIVRVGKVWWALLPTAARHHALLGSLGVSLWVLEQAAGGPELPLTAQGLGQLVGEGLAE